MLLYFENGELLVYRSPSSPNSLYVQHFLKGSGKGFFLSDDYLLHFFTTCILMEQLSLQSHASSGACLDLMITGTNLLLPTQASSQWVIYAARLFQWQEQDIPSSMLLRPFWLVFYCFSSPLSTRSAIHPECPL